MQNDNDIVLTNQSLTEFYTRNFSYFLTIDTEARKRFVYRCGEFIKNKGIIGAGYFVGDNYVKAVIAASAVQLTLGLENWDLDFFDTIIIHDGDFAAHGEQKYKGLTGGNGLIQISWNSFLHGYRVNNDKLNLGLHEFSHALRFNSSRGNKQDYFVQHYFDSWLASAYPVFYNMKAGQTSIFRKYGSTNINEFMSVCIEHYFEAPEEIKEHYPALYYSTAILLNQIPSVTQTRLHVREALFKEKEKHLPGYADFLFVTPPGNKPETKIILILLVPLIYTLVLAGPLSGPTIGLLTLILLVYMRLDFYFKRFKISGSKLMIERGLLFFKTRPNIELSSSMLISAKKIRMGEYTEWEFTYYNSHNGYFYEETFFSSSSEEERLMKLLMANKVAVYNHDLVSPY